jgi:hypothetical protein
MKVKSFLGLIVIVVLLMVAFVLPVSAAAPTVVVDSPTVIAGSPGESVVIQEDIPATVPADEFPLDKMMNSAAKIGLFCLGFTAVLKYKFSVKGNWLTASCLTFGFLLGIGYWIAMKPPTTYAEWYYGALFGFLTALATSGVYDIFNNKIIDSAG